MNDILTWIRQHASETANLSADSRHIRPGDVFFAYPNSEGDGRAYIDDAVARGAAALLIEAEKPHEHNRLSFTKGSVPCLEVTGLRQQAGFIASAFYGQPSATLQTFAVTGTNGKTTCVSWLAQALNALKQPCAYVGTLGTGFLDDLQPSGYTTPEAVLLQRRLAELRRAGAQALAIEASSIGLDQDRLQGLAINVAVFTNLSRDHLDYHGDMETYEAAKARLFTWPGLQGTVINIDDVAGRRLREKIHAPTRCLTYSANGDEHADVRATEIQTRTQGISFRLSYRGRSGVIDLGVLGEYNVANWLACCAALLAAKFPLDVAVHVLREVRPVDGRLHLQGGQNEPLVVVDYAHTPDALEKVLKTLRPVAQQRGGQLICVVGCGGQRDTGKRAPMAKVSTTLADRVILTSDNPRAEDPMHIVADMQAGVVDPVKVTTQLDRRLAIRQAITDAEAHDVVLLAGKGHERTQDIAGVRYPFYDAEEARLALESRTKPC